MKNYIRTYNPIIINYEYCQFEIYKETIPYKEGIEIMNRRLDDILKNHKEQKILFFEHVYLQRINLCLIGSQELQPKDVQLSYQHQL